MNPLVIVKTMANRGMLAPGNPVGIARQLSSLLRWGYGLAGEARQAAARSPQSPALVDADQVVTYAELVTRSDRVAHALQRLGFAPGDRLGLLARNHADAVITMVGASALGLDLVLLNTGLAASQFQDVATQQGLKAVIHDEEFTALVGELAPHTAVVSESALAAAVAAVRQSPPMAPPARAGRTIILTSGTTGAPKGAARRTPKGPGPLVSIIDRIPLRVGDRILISAPLFHTWGYAALQLSFGLRACVVLQRRFHPAQAREALTEHSCDAMFAVPVMLQRLLEMPSDPAARARRPLRVVAASGSAFPSGFSSAFMDEFGDVLYNLYGSTEASWVCIANPSDMRRSPDTAGTPPLGTRVAIVDSDLKPVPDGEVGRVFAGNDMVFEGYTDGAGKQFHDGMVATGDLGYQRDGLYFIVGREDDLVISGGENVYPRELEAALIDHPSVREVAAFGVADPAFGQRLAVVVALVPGSDLTEADIRDYVRSRVARHANPRDVILVDELPRNATGKVPPRLLRELAEGQ